MNDKSNLRQTYIFNHYGSYHRRYFHVLIFQPRKKEESKFLVNVRL